MPFPFAVRRLALTLALSAPLALLAATDAPVSPDAHPSVAPLMRFFNQIAGRYVVSGQQEIAWDESRAQEDFDYILQHTGRTPAVRGFDFLKYVESPATRAQQAATPRAIAWARSGGIVTFCLHLFVDLGSTNGQPHFYTPGSNGNPHGTNFDIRQAVIPGTPEHTELLAKIDIVAEELKHLRDAGVPVIWRPFHESGGTWFWWSRHGATPFKAAWRLMFERYTQHHGLTNLIWCFNPVDAGATLQAWYPGDDVVDMISLDVYPRAGTHPTYAASYKLMRDFTDGRKPVVLSENGSIPNIDQLLAEGGGWGYFCTWNGFGNDLSRHTIDFLRTVFNHEQVITLDELAAAYTAYSPAVTVTPRDASPAAGGSLSLTAGASGHAALPWRRNGAELAGSSGTTLTLTDIQPSDTGLYAAASSSPAIVGVSATAKVIGAAAEIADDIVHPNGNIFDQVLLSGAAATIAADHASGQITRISFIDLDDDIVQVEFSGPGSLSLVLDTPTGPAAPIHYHQPGIAYMKGHVGIVITGATEQTNVSVFSVGRLTAFDPTDTFKFTEPVSETNRPANNASPLFQGHDATAYGGIADLAFIAIASANGKFGGVRTSNAHYFASRGHTGIYAPGVAFAGPVHVGDITAFADAKPVLLLGAANDVRIAGGDLLQDNGEIVRVSGIAKLDFTAGVNSHHTPLPAQANAAILHQNDVDLTAQIVVGP